MVERRKTPRKDWVVGRDEICHSVLEWKVDYRATKRQETDPLEKTYDFLKRLDVPDLALEEENPESGRNPYDTGIFKAPRKER
jgi:hypothetical protein